MARWFRRQDDPQALTAVLLPQPLLSEVLGLASRDGEVAAVRLVRERTGLTLLPAVLAVRAAVTRTPDA